MIIYIMIISTIMLQERRKAKKGRYRDKQGFTWRPFTPQDEELPVPRAPHLSHVSPAPGPLPYQSFRPVQTSPNNQPPNNQPLNNQPPNQSFRPVQPPVAQPAGNSAPPIVPLPVIVTPNAPVPPATTRKQNGTGTEVRPAPRTAPTPRKPSSPGGDPPAVSQTPGPPGHSPRVRAPNLSKQESSCSVQSENSFQTAASDPGRAPRSRGKPRCALCSSSSTARSSGSQEVRRGRFRAQRSPRWLQGGPRAEAQGPKTWQIECFPRTLWCPQFACTVIGDCSLWWDREKPTLFAQCLAPAQKKDCYYFYIQRLSQVAPVLKYFVTNCRRFL